MAPTTSTTTTLSWVICPLSLVISTVFPPLSSSNYAQAQTSGIIPANDGTGTVVNQETNQFNITGGQQSVNGANLFHSLTKMGLEPGQIANFIAEPKIRNIVTRIVGGEASFIDGLIQVTGSDANLYLMNPAGILFGANASLNVPGDFFATTATSIGFAGSNGRDERWFNAVGDNDYGQLLGNPRQFAFSGAEPGAVINFGNLAVSPEHRLTLLGGTVISTGSLQGGQILLQTVPGTSLVRLSQAGMLLSLEVNPSRQPQGVNSTPLSLPELLTGGSATHANGVLVEPDGSVRLVGSNLQIQRVALGGGDLVVKQILPGAEEAAPSVGLSASGRVFLPEGLETGDLTIAGSAVDISAPLNTSASVSIDVTGIVTASDITTANSSVQVRAGRAIRIGNITTNGGDVLLAQDVPVSGSTPPATPSGRLPLDASPRSRTPVVSNQGITVGAIDTSSLEPDATGGNVSIAAAAGDIEVSYINAEGSRGGGNIEVTTPDNFRAIGSFADDSGNPVSIGTTSGGNIQINTGGGVFQVGEGDRNGTAGAITAGTVAPLTPGTSIPSGVVSVPVAVNPDRPTPEQPVSVKSGPSTLSLPTATDAESIPVPPVVATGETVAVDASTPIGAGVAPPPETVVTVNPTVPTTPTTVMSDGTSPVQGNGAIPSAPTPAAADDTAEERESFSAVNSALSGSEAPALSGASELQTVTPQAVNPQVAIPEVVITEVVTPEAVTPQVVITEVVTPEAVTPQVAMPEVLITEVVTPQVVIPEVVAPQAVTAPPPPQVVLTTGNDRDNIRERDFLRPLVLAAGSNLEPAEIDQLRTREFLGYLGKLGGSGLNAVPQESDIRETLATVVQKTDLKPAIVYAISLPEMLELVVVLPDGSTVRRVVSAAKRDALNALVREFISELTDPLGSRTRGLRADGKQLAPLEAAESVAPGYMRAARQLYDWLIAPIEAELQAARVDTLMFSLDAGMRALPLAALHNGEQFLVEKYRLSLIPSVALTDATYVPLHEGTVLAMGASEFQDAAVSPLPSVPVELETIARYWQGNTFLNRAFTVGNVRARQREEGYQILHLATHVQFYPENFRQSYIQFYDKRLSWNRLQELVWRDKPIELLVLSACETAFADPTQDISGPELGMAGLAAQTGAKSVLASLWQVDDGATSLLMREFYWQLSIQKHTVKAEALRRAQLALLRDRLRFQRGVEDLDLSHPYYWAAFTLVGSPW
ncbi:MAG TPA: CHAT domain-containing protein [Oscillatoriaceae cyanobacterium M33_DOE_052]|nr:CHAT domain-containing protein [Oscillatoriaceae cyanobacterium M33_DOE_052]